MEEDMILPDDFQNDLPLSEGTTDIEETPVKTESQPQETVDTEATDIPQQQLLKVQFNREEREIPIDEAIPLVQKGLNYDKVQERLQALESDPRLHFVEELANEAGMDISEYLEAARQWREQQQLDELIQQNIPEEYAREMLESRKFRQQLDSERQAKQEEEHRNSEFNEFFNYFREANGRDFVPNQDEIPASVWQANENGIPLKYAFMENEISQLRNQIQTLKQNETNSQRAPISSETNHGGQEIASEDPFLQGFNSI
jgi:hypothetical protein